MNAPGTSGSKRRPVVLLAEDDEDHVLLTQLAFEQAGLDAELRVVRDGMECMAYLERAGKDADMPRPDLMLLDMHMPRLDGPEVMARIIASEELRALPVVVLTTSTDRDEAHRMYALRCNSYVVKPVEFKAFVEAMRQIGNYWLGVATLPTWEGSARSRSSAP